MFKQFASKPVVRSFYDLAGNRTQAGEWLPTHYAYVRHSDEVRLLVSDHPGPIEVWGQRVILTKRGVSEEVKSLSGLGSPGTYFTVHKVVVR